MRPRIERSALIRNLVFSYDFDNYGTPRGEVETQERQIVAGVAFENGAAVNFTTDLLRERLLEPFDIRSNVTIPVGDYPYRRHGVNMNSDRSRAVSGSFRFQAGEFWNGDSTSIAGSLELRPNRHLNVNLNISRNDVELPNGSFTTTLVGTRVLLALTSRMFLNSFLQYNADTRQFSSNTRFNIIHRPLSDLFVVYNDWRDSDTDGRSSAPSS